MNKKSIIVVIIIILIIALAVVTGVNLSKKNSTQTNANNTPTNNSTPTPISTETPNESSEPTEQPTVEPSKEPETQKNVSNMTATQKIEYAKEIAKKTWEELKVPTEVYYSNDTIDNTGNYIITVREEATTKELVRYKVNIQTGTCETTY